MSDEEDDGSVQVGGTEMSGGNVRVANWDLPDYEEILRDAVRARGLGCVDFAASSGMIADYFRRPTRGSLVRGTDCLALLGPDKPYDYVML